jgi:cephalosporin hydroxylase
MKLTIDTTEKTIHYQQGEESKTIDLYSKDGFDLISQIWLKVGWNEKYSYTFSWMGRPIIQLPEDMIRTQEVIYRIKPDVIVETGVAHGGSLIFYASLCKALGKGRVIGVDIEIHEHNRKAVEMHGQSPLISLIEGDSVSKEVVEQVKSLIKPGETVLVLLDSNHTYSHVLAELEAYHGLVTPGSYIVATDGIMKDLYDVPRGKPEWIKDNPAHAAREFSRIHSKFILEQPAWPFNESQLDKNLTHWPGAWLRRLH